MSSSVRLTVALLALAALAMAIVGCGGGETTTVVERTVTERVEGDGADADATEASPAEEADDGAGGGIGDDEALPLSSFQSPSGNIGCVLSGGVARCDIAKHSWAAPRPAHCPAQSDAGQGLEVGSSEAGEVVCAGDTVLDPGAEALSYGSAARTGGFTCFSRTEGVTCSADATGHGFFISAQSYRLF